MFFGFMLSTPLVYIENNIAGIASNESNQVLCISYRTSYKYRGVSSGSVKKGIRTSRPSTTVGWILPVTLSSNFLMCRSKYQIQKYILTYFVVNWQKLEFRFFKYMFLLFRYTQHVDG
jgi:hypothetical protein